MWRKSTLYSLVIAAGVGSFASYPAAAGTVTLTATPQGTSLLEAVQSEVIDFRLTNSSTSFAYWATQNIPAWVPPLLSSGPANIAGFAGGMIGLFLINMSAWNSTGPTAWAVLPDPSDLLVFTGASTTCGDSGVAAGSFCDVYLTVMGPAPNPGSDFGANLVTGDMWVALNNVIIDATARDTVNVDDIDYTPIPAALPLFAGGLGVMGLLGWRRKRKAQAAIAA